MMANEDFEIIIILKNLRTGKCYIKKLFYFFFDHNLLSEIQNVQTPQSHEKYRFQDEVAEVWSDWP